MRVRTISQEIKEKCRRCDRVGLEAALDILSDNAMVNLTKASKEDFEAFQGELRSLETIRDLITNP